MDHSKHFYITTPIYYVNDRPHIGHAYTSVACDVMARFKRLDGFRVKFLTGTDEHGQKVEKSAKNTNTPPQQFVDGNAAHFRDMATLMNISADDFIRTTEPRHIASAQALWQRMQERGHIYLGSYAGWYAVRDEAYYAESELVNGKAPTGADVEWVEEPSYFFNLSKWQDKLLDWYEKNPDAIAPASRRNEVISFVKGGLKDLSISRTTFSWGVPVPGDGKHIMYVWLDALANYLSATGFPDENAQEYQQFWPASLHVVGKDIIRFHAVYWPAFLMAAELPLPRRIFAHGWWTIEGEKMSKSLGNVVSPTDLVGQFGLDAARWFLMREIPFGNDGNFSREGAMLRINSELANNIGNLAQRTLSMINKNCDGKVPDKNELYDQVKAVNEIEADFNTVINAFEEQQFHEAGQVLVNLANRYNAFIDAEAPWKLKKEAPQRMLAVLYALAEGIRHIAILLQPFCPASAAQILDFLAIPSNQRDFAHLSSEYALISGTILPEPKGVFPRVSADEGAQDARANG